MKSATEPLTKLKTYGTVEDDEVGDGQRNGIEDDNPNAIVLLLFD